MVKYFKIIYLTLLVSHLIISFNIGGFDFYNSIALNILHMHILYSLAIFGFAWFDVFGYSEIVRKKYNLQKTPLIIYRIVQAIVQWGIAIYVWQFFNYVAIIYMLSWWLGVCDHLYYVLNDDERDWYFSEEFRDMPWLWWTAFGILNKNLRNNKISQIVADWTMGFFILTMPIVYYLIT